MLKASRKCLLILLCSFICSCSNYKRLDTWNYNVQRLCLQALEESNEEAYVKALPSVVSVFNLVDDEYDGLGSGFIFDQDDNYQYIITNAHVLEGGTSFYVMSYMGQTTPAELVGMDEKADVGVVKCKILEKTKVATFPAADYTKIENPTIGSTAYAIGNPGSIEYAQTITKGFVNGVDKFPLKSSEAFEVAKFAIQIDLTLNPGNSGGPLVNESGEVIGVTTFKINVINGITYTGINYCLPINSVLRMASVIKEKGAFVRPSLGINNYKEVRELILYERGYLNVPSSLNTGIVITKHGSDSRLDIPTYSIIKSLNGYEATSLAEFRRRLYETEPGDEVEIEYYEYSQDGYKDVAKIKVATVSLVL